MNHCSQYYTCRELMQLYKAVKLWGWNSSKIGVFYNCLLLDGRKFGKHSQTIVTESSFIKLMDFVKNSIEIEEENPEYMTYQEIMDGIPQAEFYRWSPTTIGIFNKSGLLQGKRCKKEARSLVSKQSVIRLVKFTSNRFHEIAHKSGTIIV